MQTNDHPFLIQEYTLFKGGPDSGSTPAVIYLYMLQFQFSQNSDGLLICLKDTVISKI